MPSPVPTAQSVAFSAGLDVVRAAQPRIAEAIAGELAAQRDSLKLIASENYASPATLLAMGNWLSDKYAEGTIGHRFYAGCQQVDTVEAIAAEHARALFGAPHAYLQPHSGIDANLVAFWAILAHRVETPALHRAQARHVNDLSEHDWAALRHELGGQRMLGMALDAGGHLTHGFRPNISGKMFEQRSYGTDPATGLLDYDALRATAREFRPLILVGGYSAYPRRVNFALMRDIADETGATLLVDMAHFAGLVAGKVLTGDFDPMPHAHVVTTTTHKTLRGPLPHVMAAKAVALAEARTTSFRDYAQRVVGNAAALADGLLRRGIRLVTGGTDNHLILIDVSACGLTGRQAEAALQVAGLITTVLTSTQPGPSKARYVLDAKVAAKVSGQAADLLAAYPLYPDITLA